MGTGREGSSTGSLVDTEGRALELKSGDLGFHLTLSLWSWVPLGLSSLAFSGVSHRWCRGAHPQIRKLLSERNPQKGPRTKDSAEMP